MSSKLRLFAIIAVFGMFANSGCTVVSTASSVASSAVSVAGTVASSALSAAGSVASTGASVAGSTVRAIAP